MEGVDKYGVEEGFKMDSFVVMSILSSLEMIFSCGAYSLTVDLESTCACLGMILNTGAFCSTAKSFLDCSVVVSGGKVMSFPIPFFFLLFFFLPAFPLDSMLSLPTLLFTFLRNSSTSIDVLTSLDKLCMASTVTGSPFLDSLTFLDVI